jgi:putative transposase
MKRNRFTEEQIIGVLKEHELGAKTADLCRKHRISEATFYNWKSKFGGMDVSEAKALRCSMAPRLDPLLCPCTMEETARL